MSGSPVVSVVMPTHNRADLLRRAIGSVVRQTFGEWELIVVDDASTDGTFEVLENVSSQDGRVRSLRLDARAGAAVARNHAIGRVRGEYVAFLDDDDQWTPDKLEKQVAAFSAGGRDVGLVYGPFHEVDARGRHRLVGEFIAVGGNARSALLRGNVFGNSAVTVRRSLLERVGGFDERLPRLQDWDLWIRVAGLTRCACIPEPLASVSCAGTRISTDTDALSTACDMMATKYEADESFDRSDHAALSMALGRLLIEHGLTSEGRTLVRRSLRLQAGRPARLVTGALLLLGRVPYNLAVAAHVRATRWERRVVSLAARFLSGAVEMVRNRLQPLEAKRAGELRYWYERSAAEGTLGGSHYEWFYTQHFGLNQAAYEGMFVLDIGCGPRGSLEWAGGAKVRVGLDPLALEYRALGTRHHAMEYVAGASHAMPFPDGGFDIIATFNSLDHVDDLPGTIREIIRVLRPGGTLLLLAEVNQPPTLVEPITLKWDTPALFEPALRPVQVRHYEMRSDGMYASVRRGDVYDHTNGASRTGVLSAIFTRSR